MIGAQGFGASGLRAAVAVALLVAGCDTGGGSGGSSGSKTPATPPSSGGNPATVRVHFKAANWSSSLLPMTVVVHDHLGQETIVLDPGEAQVRSFLVPGADVLSAEAYIGPDFYASIEFETISDPDRSRFVVAGDVAGSGFPPLYGIGIGEWEAPGVWEITRVCTLSGCGFAPTALLFPTIPSSEAPAAGG
ncbi:MAG: hypothetical protein JXP34_17135 [Planctomycetes bacterium]|nr:hypothetical protein [Planctomycetota bacterium]